MSTGANNILANLPPTFAPVGTPSALTAIAGAFGGELSQAENTLAALMFAHWVDYADRNADALADLPLIAALYGLTPRDDETIEAFRAHLKRYVRTFIEGTMTVRGVCRIVAETLGVVIADTELDSWWNRPGSVLRTVDAAGDDAATAVFGVAAAMVSGRAAQAAAFTGTTDLSRPVDLRGGASLAIAIDGAAPVTVNLTALPVPASLHDVITALGGVAGLSAGAANGHLVLRSASVGPASSLELADLPDDAAPLLLGLAPHLYLGVAAVFARITGTVDLPPVLDLTAQRYLRLTIDGSISYEIDCAGPAPAQTTPGQIVQAIQAEAGAASAMLDGQRLVLASPTLGAGGSIAVRAATTGDVAALLLGGVTTFARGSDAAPARVGGIADLSAGVDLSVNPNLAFVIDAIAPLVVNCAGAAPQKTLAGEISAAINAAVGQPVATQNGSFVTLTGRVAGTAGRIRLLTAAAGDALGTIFGLPARRASGSAATTASFTGTADLHLGADLRALRRLQLARDSASPVIIDFAAFGLTGKSVPPAAISAAINVATGGTLASTDGARLTIASALPGPAGSVAIIPIETVTKRRFVSRAFASDEAAEAVLGVFVASAQGADAAAALLAGNVDLQDGIDLSKARFLRVVIDGATYDVDCASHSPRLRAALVTEIVQAIRDRIGEAASVSAEFGLLSVTSATTGRNSSVAVAPGGGDAAQTVFGLATATVAGNDARRVIFTGLSDLSSGLDLSAADHLRISIDGTAAVDIACAGDNPMQTKPAEIVNRINITLGGTFASIDGHFIRLASAVAGSAGSIRIEAPAERDATRRILGIAGGRNYLGTDAAPASLAGLQGLPAELDLGGAAFIRLAVDAKAPVLIDCRGQHPAKTTPAEIASTINAALAGSGRAALAGARIVVRSASAGAASRIALSAAGDGDAAALLLGSPAQSPGQDSAPAAITGTVDLRKPVDLSQRTTLRLALDNGRAIDVDVSGAAPDQTFGDEIAAAIDASLPGVAAIDGSGHLVLTTTTRGADSRIEVQPLRAFEVIEYPPAPRAFGPQVVTSEGRFSLINDGAADASVAFNVSTAGGFDGIDLIGLTTGQRIFIAAVLGGDDQLAVASEIGRIAATIRRGDGTVVPVPSDKVRATPAALAAIVPFVGSRRLAAGSYGARPTLALIDPLAANIVLLEWVGAPDQPTTSVTVRAADPSAASAPPSGDPAQASGRIELLGRLRNAGSGTAALLGEGNATIATLHAGVGVSFTEFDGSMVVVAGTWYPAGADSLLLADLVAQIFDVGIADAAFPAVALDARAGARGLSSSLAGFRAAPSAPPVLGANVAPEAALRLPRGRSDWLVVLADGARYDSAVFDAAIFAGGRFDVPGVFNASRFASRADQIDPASAISDEFPRFCPLPAMAPVQLSANWQAHMPGSFIVNLPADLSERFGASFNAASFTSTGGAGATFSPVVFEPETDTDYIVTVLNRAPPAGAKALVRAAMVDRVPLGWEAQLVPFRQPRTRYLSGGRADRPAAIYLQESGVARVIGIFAVNNGAGGDQIGVTVRYSGPALFELTVSYSGARFESARAIAYSGRVLAGGEDPLPALTADAGKPGPVGVVQAKAAGIRAAITRTRVRQGR